MTATPLYRRSFPRVGVTNAKADALARLQAIQSDPSARICQRRWKGDVVPLEPLRMAVINGLLSLRRQGMYQGIWIDADVIRVRKFAWGDPERLTWQKAAELLGLNK